MLAAVTLPPVFPWTENVQSFGDAEARLKQKMKMVGTKGSGFLKAER